MADQLHVLTTEPGICAMCRHLQAEVWRLTWELAAAEAERDDLRRQVETPGPGKPRRGKWKVYYQ